MEITNFKETPNSGSVLATFDVVLPNIGDDLGEF